MQFFGFEIKRKQDSSSIESVVAPSADDGSTLVSTAAGYYAQTINMDAVINNENDLLRKYREISGFPEVDAAIEDILNEAVIVEDNEPPVSLDLKDLKVSENIKKKLTEEFDSVLDLLGFNERGHDIFRLWYVDGRIHYQILIDDKDVKSGIKELRYIDSMKIRKIKEIKKERDKKTGLETVKEVQEYYVYNEKGISSANSQGVKLSKDSVVYCNSGLIDQGLNMVLSHLHKAIKPANQLKMIEDSLVIYRVSRAPERRIIYNDVGNIPKIKAEQYVRDIMNKYRNKLVYDANTGEIKDDRKHMSMLEDFWMPRREGGKGTEITTLQGGQNLGELSDVKYFKDKLYESLNVPKSRMQQDQTAFNIGRSAEISRDEVKFAKFINRLRVRFSILFSEILKTQLILKGIIREDEWDEFDKKIKYQFKIDNHYAELKENDVFAGRLAMLTQVDPFVGKYYSKQYVQDNVLKLSEEDMQRIDKEIEQEKEQQYVDADHQGTIAGVTQTAQQTYLQANAPAETQEAPTTQKPQ
jgi:hypothetical protein